MTRRVPLLVISAHPWAGSLCRATAAALADAPGNDHLELYDDAFPALLSRDELALYLDGGNGDDTVRSAQGRIAAARALALVFPVWWGGPPAVLKGFLDRVLLPGFAFDVRTDGSIAGRLTWLERVHLFCTLDSPEAGYAQRQLASITQIFEEVILGFCGVPADRVRWHTITAVSGSTDDERRHWIAAASNVGRDPLL